MTDTLEQLESDIIKCQRCELRFGATCPIPGIGDIGAKYFLIDASGQTFNDLTYDELVAVLFEEEE